MSVSPSKQQYSTKSFAYPDQYDEINLKDTLHRAKVAKKHKMPACDRELKFLFVPLLMFIRTNSGIKSMKKIFSSCAIVLFFIQIGLAQSTPVCGNTVADQLEHRPRLRENIATVETAQGVSDRSAIQYVPVHYHIVGDATGAGKHKEAGILDQLCDLNAAYAPMDIRFYLNPHPTYGLFNRSINNDNVYSNQNNSFLMSTRRHTKAINIYVVETPNSGNNNPGIVLAYYSPSNDWIVERKTETKGGNNGTLPHEMGHFFSLMHTFYGYESDPFGPDDAGWPTAPVISPGGIPTERVNGTNCTTAADEICDTPPDYNFGLETGNCNPYTAGALDPLGTPVDPMEVNFMGYFQDCGTNYKFTPNQHSIILADLATSSRNYLDNTFAPVATEIATPADLLVSPAAGATSQYYDEVLFQWQPVTGAQYYLLEIDLSASFGTPLLQSFVVTETSKLVTGLTANKNYQWRVRPFNQYVTCAESKQRNFRTSAVSATNDIQGLDAWQIAPNPVQSGNGVQLSLRTSLPIDAQIQLVDVAGRIIYQQNAVSIPSGDMTLELPTANLSNGLYFVRLSTENGQDVRKLIIN